jgi:hypothetical protein
MNGHTGTLAKVRNLAKIMAPLRLSAAMGGSPIRNPDEETAKC